MTAVTVATQAELDQALTAKTAEIVIDSPAGVWLYIGQDGQAWGSSSVVAWGSSSVVARGSSSVVAWDSSSVEARGSSSVEAGKYTAVHLHSARATIKGGVLIDLTKLDLTDAQTWLDYHGVTVTKAGYATLFKAVGDNWEASRGPAWTYKPGTTVTADDYDRTPDCGHGLHLGITPRHARQYHQSATKFVAVKVLVSELIPLGDKAKVRSVKVLHEVDIDGKPVTR